MIVSPLAAGAVQLTSSAGFDGSLNSVRVTVGAAGVPTCKAVRGAACTVMLNSNEASPPSASVAV